MLPSAGYKYKKKEDLRVFQIFSNKNGSVNILNLIITWTRTLERFKMEQTIYTRETLEKMRKEHLKREENLTLKTIERMVSDYNLKGEKEYEVIVHCFMTDSIVAKLKVIFPDSKIEVKQFTNYKYVPCGFLSLWTKKVESGKCSEIKIDWS